MAFDLNEKPWWIAFLIGAVLGVLIYVAANAYIFKKIEQDIAKINDNIEKLEREIQKGRAAQRDLPKLEEDIRNFELELDRLRRILPARRETDSLIKKLKQLTEQGNFRLTRFTPRDFQRRDFYEEWPINVELDGTFHELGLFFDRLSRFSRIINVSQLKISPARGGGVFTIRAVFTQVTFIFSEDS
jgi:type IV pilus assembly protein PilO